MTFYDDRETLPADARERALLARLPGQIAHARASAPAFSRLLEDVDPDTIISREALATLPVTRKSELLEQQKAARPFGGFAAVGWGAACRRVFASPGPLYEPEGARPDYYRLARALHAAGFRAGDLVHNTFSYHFTP
ncbi:MAG TPA: AMP-dependent synthetase, partial [Thauera sp.]|nr:AMP-dependent synthetase [Thauera sp.]